eukprot:202130-Rhodomonas_salina.1
MRPAEAGIVTDTGTSISTTSAAVRDRALSANVQLAVRKACEKPGVAPRQSSAESPMMVRRVKVTTSPTSKRIFGANESWILTADPALRGKKSTAGV